MTAVKPQASMSMRKLSPAARLMAWSLIFGAIAGIAFYAFPQIDLDAAAAFYLGSSVFAGKVSQTVYLLRGLLLLTNLAIFVTAGVGLIISVASKKPWLRMPSTKWLFLVLCLAVGPGLVVNYGLKSHWGRARPANIVEFGGTKAYTAPLTPSHQCRRNCSFVAGEASTIFIAFFAGAFIFPCRGRTLFVVGTVAGLAAGLVRMAQGAHFLSDVIFAGVAMGLTAGIIQLIFEAREGMTAKKKLSAGIDNPLA